MKIVLLGATGFSGNMVLRKLLQTDHQVTVLIRDKKKIQEKNTRLTTIEGNVMNFDRLSSMFEGQDIVINCLGIGGKGDGKPNSFTSDSTKKIVEAMEAKGIERLIAMSNVGAGDSKNFHPFVFRKLILPYFMKWLKVIIDDKNKMETIIGKSNLNWTVVRCSNITEKPAKGKTNATLTGKGLKLSITNSDLADFLIHQIDDITFLKKSPSISN